MIYAKRLSVTFMIIVLIFVGDAFSLISDICAVSNECSEKLNPQIRVGDSVSFYSYCKYPRGLSRLGYGKIFGFHFGKKICCSSNEMAIVEESGDLLKVKVNSPIGTKYGNCTADDFDTVTLYLLKDSHRLVRVELTSGKLTSVQKRKLHRKIKKYIGHELGMIFETMPTISKNTVNMVSYLKANDERFDVKLIIRRISFENYRLVVSVSNKQLLDENENRVMKPFDSFGDDFSIDVGDL